MTATVHLSCKLDPDSSLATTPNSFVQKIHFIFTNLLGAVPSFLMSCRHCRVIVQRCLQNGRRPKGGTCFASCTCPTIQLPPTTSLFNLSFDPFSTTDWPQLHVTCSRTGVDAPRRLFKIHLQIARSEMSCCGPMLQTGTSMIRLL